MDVSISSRGPGGTKSQQLFLLLKDAIVSGRLGPGSKLPGELKLAEEHQVSRVTVRRAMEALSDEGLVTRRAGQGTVVTEQAVGVSVMTASVANLMPNLTKLGETSRVRLLEFAYITPSELIRERLALDEGERTQRSVRIRLSDDKPFSYLVTHVPESIAVHYSESDLAATPLYVLLERSGVELDHASQTISATLATKETAPALGVQVGSPLIDLTRVVFDRHGRGIEHLQALYRPDRYRIQIDLNRAGDDQSRYWKTVDN